MCQPVQHKLLVSRPVECAETEAEFCSLLQAIYNRHAPTLVTMARGVWELRASMLKAGTIKRRRDFGDLTEVHETLDNFYTSRTGIRILIGESLVAGSL